MTYDQPVLFLRIPFMVQVPVWLLPLACGVPWLRHERVQYSEFGEVAFWKLASALSVTNCLVLPLEPGTENNVPHKKVRLCQTMVASAKCKTKQPRSCMLHGYLYP
jgi:hypothetical protein